MLVFLLLCSYWGYAVYKRLVTLYIRFGFINNFDISKEKYRIDFFSYPYVMFFLCIGQFYMIIKENINYKKMTLLKVVEVFV